MSYPAPAPLVVAGCSSPKEFWHLDAELAYLNHGSFGACPKPVLEAMATLRIEVERQPMAFFVDQLHQQIATAMETWASLLGARTADLAPVDNATTGMNAAINGLIEAGDAVVVPHQLYESVRHALSRRRSEVAFTKTVVPIPIPYPGDDAFLDRLMDAVTPATRTMIVDQVCSPTATVQPVARLAKACAERGINLIVDGAHAPGAVDVDLGDMSAAVWTGNGHKWAFAPHGCAVLWVCPQLQERIQSPVTSLGYELDYPERFLWTGTRDRTAQCVFPEAVAFARRLGGFGAVRAHNDALARFGADQILEKLGFAAVAPVQNFGPMVAISCAIEAERDQIGQLRAYFRDQHQVEVFTHIVAGTLLIRLSGQVYNTASEMVRLADALVQARNKGIGPWA